MEEILHDSLHKEREREIEMYVCIYYIYIYLSLSLSLPSLSLSLSLSLSVYIPPILISDYNTLGIRSGARFPLATEGVASTEWPGAQHSPAESCNQLDTTLKLSPDNAIPKHLNNRASGPKYH